MCKNKSEALQFKDEPFAKPPQQASIFHRVSGFHLSFLADLAFLLKSDEARDKLGDIMQTFIGGSISNMEKSAADAMLADAFGKYNPFWS